MHGVPTGWARLCPTPWPLEGPGVSWAGQGGGPAFAARLSVGE